MKTQNLVSLILLFMILSTKLSGQSFTQITTGDIVTDGGNSYGIAWGDYDNDGFIDLFVTNGGDDSNYLYHNSGDGSFTRITTGDIATDVGWSSSASWGDYNNDGSLDLFVAEEQANRLYLNNGDGSFTKVTTGSVVNTSDGSIGSWGDFDNDGLLDLYVARTPALYKNNGDGSFSNVISGDLMGAGIDIGGCNWVDYDNDGDLDLFIVNGDQNQPNSLFRNDGSGVFSKITTGDIVNDSDYSSSSSWADYDNDGDLDVFIANGGSEQSRNDFLYQNNGDGTFTKITSEIIVMNGGYSHSSSWGDMDNDGDLDLYVTNNFGDNGKTNYLYSNDGDGTFTRITSGHITTDANYSLGAGWADYDNDGDLDLFITIDNSLNNILYSNDGNSNYWTNIKCIGTTSNISSIGSKVWVKANIAGNDMWQYRELSGQTGAGQGSQNSLNAEFGLGDATVIDSIIIEWPNGGVYKAAKIGTNKFVTIREGKGILINLGDDMIACEGETITLNAGDYESYLWNDSSTGQTLDVTSAGTYSVSVTDIYGNDFSGEIIVTFDPLPVATFSFEMDNHLTITFTNTSENASSYTWDFGDNNSSSNTNPVHTYADANNYQVELTSISDNCGNATNMQTLDVILSVNQLEFKTIASIYPNPSTGVINLKTESSISSATLIEITGINGQIIYSNRFKSTDKTMQIDLSEFPKGLYIVKLKTKEVERTGKLWIE